MKKQDIARLQELGKQLRDIADMPIQQHNKKLWTAVNDLQMIRPVIHVRDYPLYLIAFEQELETTIEDAFLKEIERDLLLRLYEWNHLRCDRVIEPVVKCPVVHSDSGFGIQAFEGTRSVQNFIHGREINRAMNFECQIETEADLKKIKEPIVEYDEQATMRRCDMLREIFDGILNVKLFGRCHFRCVPLDDIMTWIGIERSMINMMEEPELMHQAINLYIDGQISRIKQYEKLGILSSNNCFENIGHNCIGYTSNLPPATESGIGAKISHLWGENSDQTMTGVSPDMTQEFSFDHERKWANMFNLHSYGCCERLDHKLNNLRNSFPRLRKVSCSPFSNLESTMEQLGNNYVISFKPNSNYLVGDTPDMEYLKKELLHACELTKKYKVNLVFNMKTLISLNGEPQRLWNWCKMASQIVDDFYK